MDVGRRDKSKIARFFVATRSFHPILVFPVVFNCLNPLKPLEKKLRKRNQDIFVAYSTI